MTAWLAEIWYSAAGNAKRKLAEDSVPAFLSASTPVPMFTKVKFRLGCLYAMPVSVMVALVEQRMIVAFGHFQLAEMASDSDASAYGVM